MASHYEKEEWERLIDPETQRAYWYNNYTGESVWVEDQVLGETSTKANVHNEKHLQQSEINNEDRRDVQMEMINVPMSPQSVNEKESATELEMALERRRSAERELQKLRMMSTENAENKQKFKKETSHQEKTTEESAKSIDDMFALAHAKARRLIDDSALKDEERVEDVTDSVNETMKIIDKTLEERIKASAETNESGDDEDEPFLSPTFKSSIQVYSENNSPIEERLDVANDAKNENGMILYNNVEEEENVKEIAEDEALQTMAKDIYIDQHRQNLG